jgi:aminopeptidase C
VKVPRPLPPQTKKFLDRTLQIIFNFYIVHVGLPPSVFIHTSFKIELVSEDNDIIQNQSLPPHSSLGVFNKFTTIIHLSESHKPAQNALVCA